MVCFGLRRIITDGHRTQTLRGPGGKAPEILPHLGCQLKAACVGCGYGLGHFSVEDRAAVIEMGRMVPMNDLGHVRVLSKCKFRDLVLPAPGRCPTHGKPISSSV